MPLTTAVAQTEIVLHSFTGGADGANPFSGVILDGKGNLYGTAPMGAHSGCSGLLGCGVVFGISATGGFKVIHAFIGGADGGNPIGGLVGDAHGNVYGTTSGFDTTAPTVFEVARRTETVLYSFNQSGDGFELVASLIRDSQGNLYGTSEEGGAFGWGTVYKVAPDGAETVLHSFEYGPNGSFPTAPLVRDVAGNLYGTTNMGGTSDLGTVFRLAPDGTETVFSFTGNGTGAFPYAGLTPDHKGNLYGTTYYTDGLSSGYGTVFKIDANGVFTVLYRFSGVDGAYPQAVLVLDGSGNLYGTTSQGGTFGYGTVFELTTIGVENVLYSFRGGTDGAYPREGLARDAQGSLYGTTQEGGIFNYGTVFKVIP